MLLIILYELVGILVYFVPPYMTALCIGFIRLQ